ncbi:Glycosyl hydrolases family 28 [Musa troglodytarum]|uniref:Glycosyl hydrolases family 28 n=1 Tax=Musa troglodytarum TaxID=320322 RepID=A0A9E7EVJ8_9LILI|nr:Glycosyl hydrolases family 28 [Musa troglodytarum]
MEWVATQKYVPNGFQRCQHGEGKASVSLLPPIILASDAVLDMSDASCVDYTPTPRNTRSSASAFVLPPDPAYPASEAFWGSETASGFCASPLPPRFLLSSLFFLGRSPASFSSCYVLYSPVLFAWGFPVRLFVAPSSEGLMKRLVVVLLLLAVAVAVEVKERGDGYCKLKNGLTSRPHSVTITEFGAVGDGVTLNTVAFQNAVFYVRSFADKGGAQLYVPKGRWLTGSFNLTSHLTLFLDEDAVIIGSQDASQWPTVEPLPSYGQGIDLPGERHRSLINGYNLTDVVITGMLL